MTEQTVNKLTELLQEAFREHTKHFFISDEEIESITENFKKVLQKKNR